jgi:probable F420-dependent oxidoreductase
MTHRPFRFGVVAAQTPSHGAWIATARRAEELGYATLLMPDRTSAGTLAPFTALAVAAQATTRLRVGSYVFCNSYRHPVVLTREAATLDLLSDGRLELGLGAGVGPTEFQQMGIPFESAGTRIAQLEETLRLVKRLFSDETVAFSGRYYTVTGLKGHITPVQRPHPPLLVAGSGQHMLQLAAREANIIAIGARITAQGADLTDASLDRKIAWIEAAAGERFGDLELARTIFDVEITDSGTPLAPQAGWQALPKRALSTEQVVAHLIEQRERTGVSYLQVSAGQMDNFAPVAARLSNT